MSSITPVYFDLITPLDILVTCSRSSSSILASSLLMDSSSLDCSYSMMLSLTEIVSPILGILSMLALGPNTKCFSIVILELILLDNLVEITVESSNVLYADIHATLHNVPMLNLTPSL